MVPAKEAGACLIIVMKFNQQLARFRFRHRAGRLLALGLAAIAGVILVTLVLIGLDLMLAFETQARVLALKIAGGFVAIIAGISFLASIRLSRSRSADLADDALASPRRPVAAALAIDPETAATPLAAFLARRSLDEAASALDALPVKLTIPLPWLRRAVFALVGVALVAGIFRLAAPAAFTTALNRIVHPTADIPPWSKFQFIITPEKPAVIYGSDLLVTCDLQGDKIDKPVECLLRQPGSSTVLRLPVSRESATRFSRRLDAVTQPLEFAFACGKARSRWLPVEVLLQPNFLAGSLQVTPPAYMDLPASRGPLDTREISVPEGAEVVLELSSNRPLGSATLTFTPVRNGTAEPVPVETLGEVSGHTASFRFTASRSGNLSASIRDVRGTASAKPSELKLTALPDQAPVIDLVSPPPLLLATPKSQIPIDAKTTDDLGLARVQLVRTLSGFRDRSQAIAAGLVKTRGLDVKSGLDLAALGLEAGQTIELFVEASDHNPSLLGQGASGIARIQIITETDYATRLRAQTTLAEFAARFQAIAEAQRQANEALEKMDKATDANDPAAAEKARQESMEAHRQAAEMLDKLAKDFPVFEIEKRLKELAEKAAGAAKENLEALEKFDPKAAAADQHKAIQEMRDRFGKNEPQMQELQKDAADIAEAGKLLEMAAKFQQIYQTQQSLVKRMDTLAREIARGNDQSKRLLASLGETQQKNREALDEFARELEARANALTNPTLEPMRESALEFLQQLKLSDPGSVMDAAAKYARDGLSNDAATNAELARALLETLMEKPNPFPKACKGQCMKFSIPNPDVNQTMQQLLEALMCQNPGMSPNQGTGGGGMGAGGTGPTGSAMPGFSMSDLPIIGPERMLFQPASLGASGNGQSKSSRPKPLATKAENSTLKPSDTRDGSSGAPDPEAVPAIYRDAVKRYFSAE
jgi:hypothetical protein